MLIDSHCHLSFKDYPREEIDGVLTRAKENGVDAFVNIGAGDAFEGNAAALDLAQKYSNIFCTVGIHPHDAKIVDAGMVRQIEEMAKNPKVVAIGEIGLDFHYLHSPQDIQENVFQQFIELAKKVDKPIMIHDRDAGERTYEIIRDHVFAPSPGLRPPSPSRGEGSIGVMIHCFTGTMALAKKYLALGCLISFTGIITFKKADELREVVKMVPLDQMLVETDSPFLTPAPFRGKRNEPANVRQVAEKVAEIRGISLEEVATQTTQNAIRFFKLPL